MLEYNNEGVGDDPFHDKKSVIRTLLETLFGLYPMSKKISSVLTYTHGAIRDLEIKEIESFCNYWANSDKNHSPDHKDIIRYVKQIRLRSDDVKEFEITNDCVFNKCDGSGFLEGIRDNYRYIFRCDCNAKTDFPVMKNVTQFDDVSGLQSIF